MTDTELHNDVVHILLSTDVVHILLSTDVVHILLSGEPVGADIPNGGYRISGIDQRVLRLADLLVEYITAHTQRARIEELESVMVESTFADFPIRLEARINELKEIQL